MEIERKWLLHEMPKPIDNGTLRSHMIVYQIYYATNPTLRATKIEYISNLLGVDPVYKITMKSSGLLSREELETEVSAEIYRAFEDECLAKGYKPIIKEYYKYQIDRDHVLEVCNVEGVFSYCEIEFKTEQEARNFSSDDIMKFLNVDYLVDVTDSAYYKMKNYWSLTRIYNLRFDTDNPVPECTSNT